MSGVSRVEYSQLSDSSYSTYQNDATKPLLGPLSVFGEAVEKFAITNEQAYKWLELFQIRKASLNVSEIERHKDIVRKVFGLVETVGITSKDGTVVFVPASKLRKYRYFSQILHSPVIDGKTTSATVSWAGFERSTLEVFKNYVETGSLRCDFFQLVDMYDIGCLIEDKALSKKSYDAIILSSGKIGAEGISSVMSASFASQCYDEGNFEQAIQAYAKAIDLRATDIPSLLSLARILAEQKRFSCAIGHLSKTSKKGFYNPEIQFTIAQISLQQIRFLEEDAERAIIAPLTNLKKALFDSTLAKGELTKQIETLKAKVQADEELLYAFGKIADYIAKESAPLESIQKLEELFYTTRQEKVQEILKNAEATLRKQPETKVVLHLLGIVLFERKDYEGAVKKFTALHSHYRLEVDEEKQVLSYLGRGNLLIGEAIDQKLLARYLAMKVDSRYPYYYLVDLVDAADIAPDDPIVKKLQGIEKSDALECLGRYYMRQEDLESAETCFEKVLKRRQEADAICFFHLAVIAKKKGDPNTSLYFEKALFFDCASNRALSALQCAIILQQASAQKEESLRNKAFAKIAAMKVDELCKEDRKEVANHLVEVSVHFPRLQRVYYVEACRYDAAAVIECLEEDFGNLTISPDSKRLQSSFTLFVKEQIRRFKQDASGDAFEFLLEHYQDNPKKMQALLESAVQKFPEDHVVKEKYCTILCDRGMYAPSKDIALTLQPEKCAKNFVFTLCTLAKWSVASEALEQAHSLLEMAEKIDPDNGCIRLEAMRLAIAIDVDEPLQALLLADKNPEFAAMLEARARRYAVAGNYVFARRCVEIANIIQQNASRQFLLGSILLSEKQLTNGFQAYKVGLDEVEHRKEDVLEVASLVRFIETNLTFDTAFPKSVRDLNVQALLCMREGNLDAAFEHAKKSLELDSNQPAMQSHLFELFLARGRTEEALSLSGTNDLSRILAYAELALSDTRYEEAELFLNHLQHVDVRNTDVQTAFVNLYIAQNQFEKAKKYIDSLNEVEKRVQEAHFIEAMVSKDQIEQLDFSHLEGLLRHAKKLATYCPSVATRYALVAYDLCPENTEALNMVAALSHTSDQHTDEVISLYKRSLELDSSQAEICALLIELLFKKEAIEEIPKYAQSTQTVVDQLLSRAFSSRFMSDFEKEKRYLLAALCCMPNHQQALISLVRHYIKAEGYADAHSYLLKLYPSQPTLLQEFLQAIVETSDWTVDAIAELIRPNTHVLSMILEKVKLHNQSGNVELAKRYHEIAQRLFPTDTNEESDEDAIGREIAIIDALITNKKEEDAFVRYTKLINKYGYRNGALRIKEVATRLGDRFFDEKRRDKVEELAKLLISKDKNNLIAKGFQKRVKLEEGAVLEFQKVEINPRQNWQTEFAYAKEKDVNNSSH
jgi:Tfp pilus assembly protein PilF